MSLANVVEFKIENGMLIIEVDPNKDGQNVLVLHIDLAEIPDEVLSVLKKDNA